jgi:NAD-dependent dihydropyrimidine dehydrogenase PreA subunit
VDKDDRIYSKLQQHLNQQAVGFPWTFSRAEIKILKFIFTPYEAEIASYLSYKPEPLEIVFEKVKHLVRSREELASMLDRIHINGGIGIKVKNGEKVYLNLPLVVGMYEKQIARLSQEFLDDFDKYTSGSGFGIAFLSTGLPQMRTIPVARSILPQHRVSTFDEVTALLQQADAPFAAHECMCRKKKVMEGKSCKVTKRKETCLALGGSAQSCILGGTGKEISREEAISIIELNQKEGLVLQPSNTQKAEWICSCCGCCCGVLSMHSKLPKPLDFWASNFQAMVDTNKCEGCGACAKRCQVGAVKVEAKKQPAVVNLSLCIGCGLCASICPKGAISLFKKPTEVMPPETVEDLYDIIMAGKKGRLEKLKLGGKLLIDVIRTGRTDLIG